VIALGLVLAVVSAVAINGGYGLQHASASALPPLSLRRPLRSLESLFRSGAWSLGFFAGIGGWVLYVVALRIARSRSCRRRRPAASACWRSGAAAFAPRSASASAPR